MTAGPPLIRSVLRASLLCLVAGYVDAFGYIMLDRVFAANMTGNTVLLAIAAAKGELVLMRAYVLTLSTFFLAAILGAILKRLFGRGAYLTLVLAAGLLFIAAAAEIERTWTLPFLAAAMGLQGSSISRFGPASLQTVVVTGTIVRLAEELVQILVKARHGDATEEDRSTGVLFAVAWVFYAVGAGAGAVALVVLSAPLILPGFLLLAVAADLAIEHQANKRRGPVSAAR
ncbi:MAG TPA: YoaK family protein [Alphaproteobacteria bacterium]|nr:YoaK family protein [Alphaproteobacteria bacterium]